MNQQIQALNKANRELKEHLQDALMLAAKYKSNMGLIDQEELARLSSLSKGGTHNAKTWDFTDKNGEQ